MNKVLTGVPQKVLKGQVAIGAHGRTDALNCMDLVLDGMEVEMGLHLFVLKGDAPYGYPIL
ncbi:MAG: hypothetical protein CMO42_06480 [Verrucomicrobiales bacterium]|nr:hypothetical protein [Verrucomicrobiales bacterium]